MTAVEVITGTTTIAGFDVFVHREWIRGSGGVFIEDLDYLFIDTQDTIVSVISEDNSEYTEITQNNDPTEALPGAYSFLK